MNELLLMLPEESDDSMRAFMLDLALPEVLRDGHRERAREIATELVALSEHLYDGESTYVARLATAARVALAAAIAGVEPPALPDKPRRQCGYDDEILRALAHSARALAGGVDLAESAEQLRGLVTTSRADEQAAWLRKNGRTRGAAMYLVGCAHAALGILAACDAQLASDDERSAHVARSARHMEFLHKVDGLVGGPSILTRLPNRDLVAGVLAR